MDKLHMVQMKLDALKFFSFLKQRNIPFESEDYEYGLHMALLELFGKRAAPRPFSLVGINNGLVSVLGYAEKSAAELSELSRLGSPVDLANCVLWDLFQSKEMPQRWTDGMRVSFEVKVCPVRRKSIAQKMIEKDAFLYAVEILQDKQNQNLNRETVYREWLCEQMEATCNLEKVKMFSFNLKRLLRRRNDGSFARYEKAPQKPNACFRGYLTIKDGQQFKQLLKRGVGRHRAFGFGMLLLKPA